MSVLIALSVFVTPITVSAEELSTPSGITYSQIDNELDSYIETYEEGLASCDVAVFDKNGLITSNYYGYSDIENQVEADASTLEKLLTGRNLRVWNCRTKMISAESILAKEPLIQEQHVFKNT